MADFAPTAFGLGPLPGLDLTQAADVVLSETPLPHIPQLPERGVDAVGRTAALLEIPIGRGPRGWRVAPRKRGDADLMARDLDQLEERWHGKVDTLKVQLVGPWTLAAEIEMPNGHRAITDSGALRDITEALVEAAGGHRRDVEKRLAPTVLQLDEPRLSEVMAGTLTGVTEFETIPAVPEPWERLAQFGDFLLNTPQLIDGSRWQSLNPAHTAKDDLAAALDRGVRVAIPPMEPRALWRLFDELQMDPAEAAIDVYAGPGADLLDTAANYRAAREMADELSGT